MHIFVSNCHGLPRVTTCPHATDSCCLGVYIHIARQCYKNIPPPSVSTTCHSPTMTWINSVLTLIKQFFLRLCWRSVIIIIYLYRHRLLSRKI